MAIVQDREIAGLLEEALLPQPVRPKAVLFGDSMSEYVGYYANGNPNAKYGASVADVIGNNLGIQVQNLATGGETSNEALSGGAKFGAFADYITQVRPEYAIIRYGAADAIKNEDPNVTLESVQRMVEIARANGVTPIIVGVSELYGAQNSKTGNIAGYIDPGAEQRANAINEGLAQIAANNGVAFTDVRSAVSAGQGDLLDGVHTNADFGKKMADAISESIVQQGAIQGVNVPQLPPNVDSLSNEEKGRLYNQFIEQGFSDAQIRTAAKAESDQDWNALKQIAASVKNTTPATIERRAALEAAPAGGSEIMMAQSAADGGAGAMTQGLLQPTQASVLPPQIAGQATSMVAPSLLSAQEAAELREAQAMGGAGFGRPTDIVATSNLAPVDIAYLAQGKGMFGNPLLGYDPTSPLQWALQSGIGVPATQFLTQAGMNLLGLTDASVIAQDASQLAGQGLSESQIISTLKASGVPTGAAVSAAEGAVSGASVFSIAQDIASTAYRTAATVAPSVSPVVSEVAAQSVPVTGGLLSGGIADVVSALPSVQVTGSTQQSSTPTAPVVPVQQILTTAPTQQVQVQNRVDPDTASQIISSVTGIPVSVAGSTQQVQVSGQATREISQSDAAQVLSSIVGQQVNVTAPRVQETATDATAAASSLLAPTQTVSVTAPPAQTRPTDAASLLNVIPTQTVPVTAPTVPSSQVPSIVSAATGGLLATTLAPTQTVPVTGQAPKPISRDVVTPATTLVTQIAPTQTVPVEDRRIPPPEPPPIITAPVGPPPAPIRTPQGEVPIEDRVIPRDQFQPITGSVPLAGLGLGLALPVIAAGSSLLTQNQGGPSFDQALADTIIGGSRPTYGAGSFVPGLNYFQIAPTNVYNPFATTPPFGAGRFGAINQPFVLPRGLI